MMKKTLLLFILGACLIPSGVSQINSNPGSFNWSNPAAWSGGVVPTSTDVVNIVLNSTITLDAPLVHAADINILNLGTLSSGNPMNDLMINGADLNLTGISSTLNFTGINAVPVTINDGHLNSAGSYNSGDLEINNVSTPGSSANAGDMFVMGTMTITGNEMFDNQNLMTVSGALSISLNCVFTNYLNANLGSVSNGGTFDNQGSVLVNGNLDNDGDLSSTANNILINGNMNNNGDAMIIDSMDVQGNFNNAGTFSNEDGQVNIVGDCTNAGTITGILDGYYQIGAMSTNDPTGIINGDIDVCDTSLTGLYLDIQMGTIDFNTVTFCGISYASVNEINNSTILIYPNPATNFVAIEMIESGNVSVYSMDGKLVLTNKMMTGLNTVDVSNLHNGFYSVVILTATHISSTSLVKQ